MNLAILIRSLKKNNLLLIGVISLLYFISGKIGLEFASVNPSTTAIWPPTGISLAFFILLGYRIFPAIFLGAFFVNLSTTGFFATSLGIALGNTLEGVVGAYLVNKFANGVNVFDRPQDIFKFTILASAFSTTISATIGTLTLLWGGLLELSDFYSVWITWWLGDAGGALIVAPLVIIWANNKNPFWIQGKIFETILLFIFIIILGQTIFIGVFPPIYLSIPLLMWFAFRLSQKEAATAVFLLSGIAIFNTINGVGPFIEESKNINEALLLLQLFMGTISITTLVVVSVVLEQKKMQDFLKASQRHFKSLIERGSDAIMLVKKNGKISYSNGSVLKQLGFSPNELVNHNIFSLLQNHDLKSFTTLFKKIKQIPGDSFLKEFRLKHKNSSFLWFEITGINLIKEPNIEAIIVSFHNITERKQSEEIKYRLVTMINSSKDAIFSMNLNGIVTIWNRGAQNMYGYKASEIIGKPISTIYPKEKAIELNYLLNTVKKRKHIDSYETLRVKKDGALIPVANSYTPIKDSSGKVQEVAVLSRDLSQEKDLEKRKDEFISMASHELNTPLTSLSVYLQSLQKEFEKNKNSEASFYLLKMDSQVQRTKHLIRDLLDISRIRLGILSFNYKKFDLNTLIKDTVEVFRYMSKKHKIIIDGKIENNMYGDEDRIGQVLTNLLSNAIKYSPSNTKIIIKLSSNDKEAIVSVQDFGIGIARKDKERIFERYYRISRNGLRGKVNPGLGIGLYLSLQIIERHKGKLGVNSKIGKGSTFYFTLPYK